jgi:pimeloyl-ACP methyl ester carboxylesterase
VRIVFLHALPLDERMWEPQLGGLGGLDVAAPRLYGRGNTMQALAESVLAELPGDLIVVGASMGGYAALAMARQAPERLQGIVLAGSRPDADSDERRAGRADTIDRIRKDGAEGLWEMMRDRLFPKDAPEDVVERSRAIALEQDPDELVAAVEAIRDREDNTELARSFGDRFLMIVGENDPFVSVDEARAFSTGAEAVFVGTGHLPSLEHPERFNHVVGDFAARWT